MKCYSEHVFFQVMFSVLCFDILHFFFCFFFLLVYDSSYLFVLYVCPPHPLFLLQNDRAGSLSFIFLICSDHDIYFCLKCYSFFFPISTCQYIKIYWLTLWYIIIYNSMNSVSMPLWQEYTSLKKFT